jgi:maltooligosyltrehalose synthase
VTLPTGTWHDVLSDDEAVYAGGELPLADLLVHRPVALLVKQS